MASNQFNSWEPVLDAVNGRMQQEPRVFAHDAVSVTTGAVNTTWGDGGVSALTNPGTGYAVASGVATTVAPAGGTGLTVNIVAVDAGVITSFEIADVGAGYSVGDVVTITGGGANATFTITNVDIPNTQKRGCCLYVGVAGDYGVMLESGNTATFKGVAAGSFLPVLAKQVTSGIASVGDVLALY